MGALVEAVKAAGQRGLEELADTIYGEMTGIVSAHSRSGEALGSIKKEVGAGHAFVGGSNLHLYYLDQGNGNGRIYPKHAPALYLKDYGIWRGSVRTYRGIHFVREIADRHR